MQIGREHFTVVGVLSPDIEFGNIGEIEVWLPLRLDPMGAARRAQPCASWRA